MLCTGRRRPVPPRPGVRPQRLVTRGGVGAVELDALPSRFLTELGTVPAVPAIRRTRAQWPTGHPLPAGIGDVVVGLVVLLGAREGVAGRAPLAAEPVDVHVPDVEARLALDDPLGHHLADSAG